MQTKFYQIVAALMLVAATCAAQDRPATRAEKIAGTRPVADALVAIEQAYLVPINYEDIHYSNRDVELTTWKLMQGWTVQLRNDVTIQSSFAARKQAAVEALNDVLKRHEQGTGFTDVFGVVDRGDSLEIVPKHSPKGGGLMENVVPMLDTRVNLPAEQRTAADLVNSIGEQVWQLTGMRLTAGTIPQPLFMLHTTTIGANNEPARSVLTRLLKEVPVGYFSEPNIAGGSTLIPTTLAWQVWCGSSDSGCAINIHVVSPKGRAVVGMEPPDPTGQ
jgi:hypothetical protein